MADLRDRRGGLAGTYESHDRGRLGRQDDSSTVFVSYSSEEAPVISDLRIQV